MQALNTQYSVVCVDTRDTKVLTAGLTSTAQLGKMASTQNALTSIVLIIGEYAAHPWLPSLKLYKHD
jgi:hypothetical protein